MLASVRSLVSPRSPTCGAACRSDPCTLRRIRYAERELEAEPALVLWAELGVVAHVIGEPMPVLTSGMLSALARFDPRHRECVLSHAVDGAVRARAPMLVRQLSPAELGVHVNDAMNSAVTGDDAGHHRCDWRRWRIEVDADPMVRRRVLHGMDRPSRLETALDCSAADPAWPDRLADVLDDFVPTPWPAEYLGGR